jgi:hypothetical protein
VADVLDRVRKLLALAGSPNVHEAAAAAGRAQALIAQYRLAHLLDADADPVTDGSDAPLHRARRLRKWRVVLASELAHVNGCVAWTLDLGSEQQICVAGRAADRAAVGLLWDALLQRIEWLSAAAGDDRPRGWHEAFRIGAVEAVAERLAAGAATIGEEGLVALGRRDDAVERFVAEKLHLKPGRGMRVDADGYDRGRAAGARIALPVRGG